jgi:hypothetical protein
MEERTNEELLEASNSTVASLPPNATTITISSDDIEENDRTSSSHANHCAFAKNESSNVLTQELNFANNKYCDRLKALYKYSMSRRKRRETSDIHKYNGLVLNLNKCKKAKCLKTNAICKHDIKFFNQKVRMPLALKENLVQNSVGINSKSSNFANDSSLMLRGIYNIENDKMKFLNTFGKDLSLNVPKCSEDYRTHEMMTNNENHLCNYLDNCYIPVMSPFAITNIEANNSKKNRERALCMSFISLSIILFFIISYFGVLLFLRITSVPFNE